MLHAQPKTCPASEPPGVERGSQCSVGVRITVGDGTKPYLATLLPASPRHIPAGSTRPLRASTTNLATISRPPGSAFARWPVLTLGTLDRESVCVHDGEVLSLPLPTGEVLNFADVELLPVHPQNRLECGAPSTLLRRRPVPGISR